MKLHAAVVRRPLPTVSLPTRDENCGRQERPEAVDVGRSAGRTLALPQEVEHWSLTTLRDKPLKIGVKVVRHGRYARSGWPSGRPEDAIRRHAGADRRTTTENCANMTRCSVGGGQFTCRGRNAPRAHRLRPVSDRYHCLPRQTTTKPSSSEISPELNADRTRAYRFRPRRPAIWDMSVDRFQPVTDEMLTAPEATA